MVVPQHGFVLIPLIVLLKFWFRSKARIVLTIHNVLPHERRVFDNLFSRLAFRFSDRLLVHAEKLREEAIQHFRQDPRKIVVIPHGICTDTAVPTASVSRAPVWALSKSTCCYFSGSCGLIKASMISSQLLQESQNNSMWPCSSPRVFFRTGSMP